MKSFTTSVLASLLFSLSPSLSHADDANYFVVNGLSYHFDRSKDHNERNYGLGLEVGIKDTNWRLVGGFYRNSINNDSAYLGASYRVANYGPVSFNLLGGVINGYKANGGFFIPMILPTVSVEYKHVGLNFYAIPTVGDVDGVAAVQFKVKF